MGYRDSMIDAVFCFAWKLFDGTVRRSMWTGSLAEVREQCEKLNRKCPDLKHWPEEVSASPEAEPTS